MPALLLLAFLAAISVAQPQPPFTDPRDNKIYRIVKIGEQVWMAENLNYEAKGSKCYDNKPENCKKYGRLYIWEDAMKACPKGWHLPSKAEWDVLLDFAGGYKVSGKKLKANSGWDDYEGKSGNGTDDYGFDALPSGEGAHGEYYEFANLGMLGNWWTATEEHKYNFMSLPKNMGSAYEATHSSGHNKGYWFSVRCVRD